MVYKLEVFGRTESTRPEYKSCMRRANCYFRQPWERSRRAPHWRNIKFGRRAADMLCMCMSIVQRWVCVRSTDTMLALSYVFPFLSSAKLRQIKVMAFVHYYQSFCVHAVYMRSCVDSRPDEILYARRSLYVVSFHLMRAVFRVFTWALWAISKQLDMSRVSLTVPRFYAQKICIFFLFAYADEGTLTCVRWDTMIFGIFSNVWKWLRIEQWTME